MEKDTLEISCILVTNVGSVSHLVVGCIAMQIFIRESTGALNAANVVETILG